MIKGNDISHWQNDKEFKKCLDNAGFIILKATEGRKNKDPTFLDRIDLSIISGKNVGAYHFWKDNASADLQAENFYSSIKKSYELTRKFWHDSKKIPYLLALDVENCVINPKEINKFLDIIEKIANQRPTIYMSLSDYKKHGINDKINKYWIASWSRESNDIFKYENVILHQYTDKPIDADIFKFNDWRF